MTVTLNPTIPGAPSAQAVYKPFNTCEILLIDGSFNVVPNPPEYQVLTVNDPVHTYTIPAGVYAHFKLVRAAPEPAVWSTYSNVDGKPHWVMSAAAVGILVPAGSPLQFGCEDLDRTVASPYNLDYQDLTLEVSASVPLICQWGTLA